MDTRIIDLSEDGFADLLVKRLKKHFKYLQIQARKPVLYSLTFEDDGNLNLHQNKMRHPKRGAGKGFQQDILIYENLEKVDNTTAIVPRVTIEIKLAVTSHDAIVYSEKAHRIRSIYPFIRYGLILAGKQNISPKVVRLGPEFDFIQTMNLKISNREVKALLRLLKSEVKISRQLGKFLSGKTQIKSYHSLLKLS